MVQDAGSNRNRAARRSTNMITTPRQERFTRRGLSLLWVVALLFIGFTITGNSATSTEHQVTGGSLKEKSFCLTQVIS
jgi:hypothetical protein